MLPPTMRNAWVAARRLVRAACWIFAVLMSLPATAQAGRLLINENPGALPRELTVGGNALYFSAYDGVHGSELWRIDETGRARMVYDLVEGPVDSFPRILRGTPRGLAFNARQRVDAFTWAGGLFYTEGTPETTRRLTAHLHYDDGSVNEQEFLALFDMAVAGDSLVIMANWGAVGTEIGLFDTTTGGDRIRIVDTTPGFVPGLHPDQRLAAIADRVYFASRAEDLESALWVTDGTPEGTVPLRGPDGRPIAGGPMLQRGQLNGKVLSLNDCDRYLFWIGDGETDQMRPVPRPEGMDFRVVQREQVAATCNHLYFQADCPVHGVELWRTDGTAEGTGLVKDIEPGRRSSWPYALTPLDDRLVFVAITEAHGKELWITDGTPEGTRMLADLYPGPVGSEPYQLTAYRDMVLFACTHPEYGEQLWRTDGTPEGTRVVRHIYPGNPAEPYYLAEFNGNVYFSASSPGYSQQVWQTDGTEEGTVMAAAINPPQLLVNSSRPRQLTPAGDHLYFTARHPDGRVRVWRTGGCSETTSVAPDPPDGLLFEPDDLRAAGEALVFTALLGHERRCWRWDGQGLSAVPCDEVPEGAPVEDLRELLGETLFLEMRGYGAADGNWAYLGDTLYFAGYGPGVGIELWALPAGASVPHLVKDCYPGPASSNPSEFVVVNDLLFFVAEDPTQGVEIWQSDGTPEGTYITQDYLPSPVGGVPHALTAHHGGLYALHRHSAGEGYGYGLSLHIPGPHPETSIPIDRAHSVIRPRQLTPAGRFLYFTADHPRYGEELWRTDGTRPGTQMVKNILPSEVFDEDEGRWAPAKNLRKNSVQ